MKQLLGVVRPYRRFFSFRFWFLFVLPFLFARCQCNSGTQIKLTASPNLVIIGEDLSGTFQNFPPTTEEDLRRLCKAVKRSAGGGKVYFIGIGTSSPKGYVSCTIRPKKKVNKKDPASIQFDTNNYNKKIEQKNETEIETFVNSAVEMSKEHGQKYTDINGFFDKVASILSTPKLDDFNKWLYINSDGKQDTPGSKKVDCSLRPEADHYFVNKGWKNAPDCGAAGKLPDTQHFVEHFEQEIKYQIVASKNQ